MTDLQVVLIGTGMIGGFAFVITGAVAAIPGASLAGLFLVAISALAAIGAGWPA